MKAVVLIAIAIALDSFAGPVIAAPAPAENEPVTGAVGYSDLNLSLPQDRVKLRRRINSVVVEMCATPFSSKEAAIVDPMCFQGAMRDALVQMETAIALANGSRNLASTDRPRP